MLHISPTQLTSALPLHGGAATRRAEAAALPPLPAHTLMERAAQALHRLGRALYPHAQHIWVACGPGNNGGDGLWAAALWQHSLRATMGTGQVSVTWLGDETHLPDDARYALQLARQAGVQFVAQPPPHTELVVDALLGIGASEAAVARLSGPIDTVRNTPLPVLCADLPSGLHPDTGQWMGSAPAPTVGPRHTLSLLTLKPGLFTASGRDAAGDIWWDDLACPPPEPASADAWLYGPPLAPTLRQQQHSAHKGRHGDVVVLGGQDVRVNGQGMTGAALLAARSATHAGAGRVLVGLLGTPAEAFTVDPLQADVMFRNATTLTGPDTLAQATVVCGCGGGQAVADVLPAVLAHSQRLVLDADALNAVAASPPWQAALEQRAARGLHTVLTPHPLEAARLLGYASASAVQAHRLHAAQTLAERLGCVVVLKGSGSVVAAPGRTPHINPTGNNLLACAGTGDVLAGMLGAYWASRHSASAAAHETVSEAAWRSATLAVYQHGLLANQWPTGKALTASALAQSVTPS